VFAAVEEDGASVDRVAANNIVIEELNDDK
jgi:hypothetical protein